ncbi:MAG: hypothetical protein NTV97_17435 [Alphaproteobacteria bacterium]|nr:hypothetical protein [Alphaproteobacteria bacterium]
MSGPHHFVAADPLAFEGTHYSHYDGCYVYYFRSLKDGRITSWWLNDGYSYPSEDWREFFEPL